MKNNISSIFFIVLLGLTSCNNQSSTDKGKKNSNSKNTITIKGSDTVLPLAQKEAEEYMKKDSTASITVVGGGSGVGLTALVNGTTDIAMSSRHLKIEEKLKFLENKKQIEQTIVAYDALSIIVNPQNKINQLTREQLEKMFTGEITNWKEVGGYDEKVVAYSRESSSGTFEFFKEVVMNKKNYASSVLSMPATGAIVQSISQTRGAIGYIGLAYETVGVKPISVSFDSGHNFIMPSIAAAKDKSYPISRPLYYLYDKKDDGKVNAFINFVLSPEGQQLVSAIGYVPIN